MWTPLRAPKIYGFMRGFQRWVWWPKCDPASINCCIVTVGSRHREFLSGYASGRLEPEVRQEACFLFPRPGTGMSAFHVDLIASTGTGVAPNLQRTAANSDSGEQKPPSIHRKKKETRREKRLTGRNK